MTTQNKTNYDPKANFLMILLAIKQLATSLIRLISECNLPHFSNNSASGNIISVITYVGRNKKWLLKNLIVWFFDSHRLSMWRRQSSLLNKDNYKRLIDFYDINSYLQQLLSSSSFASVIDSSCFINDDSGANVVDRFLSNTFILDL